MKRRCETIEELKAVKDPVAVKAIMRRSKKTAFNPEDQFDELLETISGLRPKVPA